ncbi:hypothetical protein QYF36_023778 [Acer negundo]|nr:hypothetical protein QYF36_023778 [Acer negundo]
MTGVNAGLSCVMERVRGKENVQSSMMATFGSEASFSLVSGMDRANHATNATISRLCSERCENPSWTKLGSAFLITTCMLVFPWER